MINKKSGEGKLEKFPFSLARSAVEIPFDAWQNTKALEKWGS
jgi:hypothetical protein